MANIRTILNLTPEALNTIDDHAASPRRRGAWVSLAIVGYARMLREQEKGAVARLDTRLGNIELTLNRVLHALQRKKQR